MFRLFLYLLIQSIVSIPLLKGQSTNYKVAPGFIERLVLTVKVNGGRTDVKWSSDSTDYVLRIQGAKQNEIDDIHGAAFKVSLISEMEKILAEKQITPHAADSFPLRLIFSQKGMLKILTAGQREIFSVSSVEPPRGDSFIEIIPEKSKNLLYHDFNSEIIPPSEIIDFTASTDSTDYCGTWKYLDGVTPKSGSILAGGKYTLCLIPDPEDEQGYIALYVSGATLLKNVWEPGALKARFKPTDFEGHFDVEWFAADRVLLSDEVSATFQGDNLLIVEFPLLDSSLRFSRRLAPK